MAGIVTGIKVLVKQIIPKRVLGLLLKLWGSLKKLFVYREYDSDQYWKTRAQGKGQSRVMWTNEEYNKCYRKIQKEFLRNLFLEFPTIDSVLDIGCGIGIVAKMLLDISPEIRVDAVDFSEMIVVARKENYGVGITYIESSAEEYYNPDKKYRLIISSACFSAIRDVKKMEAAIENCMEMIGKGGLLVMIDPFHRWNYLARVKYSSRQVIEFVQKRLMLIYKGGVLFWPYREWLANSNCQGQKLETRFKQGEKLLSIFGQFVWADYKILVFKKKDDCD